MKPITIGRLIVGAAITSLVFNAVSTFVWPTVAQTVRNWSHRP